MSPAQKIAVRNLSAARSGRKVLDSISCEFTPGEVTALIGPNGSGKSTLADCLSGFLFAKSGSMHINGIEVDLRKAFSPYKHSVCRTFQTPRIAKQMTVFDHVFSHSDSAVIPVYENEIDRIIGAISYKQFLKLLLNPDMHDPNSNSPPEA